MTMTTELNETNPSSSSKLQAITYTIRLIVHLRSNFDNCYISLPDIVYTTVSVFVFVNFNILCFSGLCVVRMQHRKQVHMEFL